MFDIIFVQICKVNKIDPKKFVDELRLKKEEVHNLMKSECYKKYDEYTKNIFLVLGMNRF